MSAKPRCLHMPGKMIKLDPATKAILTPQNLKMTCTVEEIQYTNTLGQNRPGGGVVLSITDIPLSTEMMVLGRPKRRWRDNANVAAQAPNTSPYNAEDMGRMSVCFNYRTTLWISKTSCNGRFGTGWTVRVIECRWRARFVVPVQTGSGLTQPPVQWVPGLFPGGKSAGAWRWPPTSN
jgi:hypothetical protein